MHLHVLLIHHKRINSYRKYTIKKLIQKAAPQITKIEFTNRKLIGYQALDVGELRFYDLVLFHEPIEIVSEYSLIEELDLMKYHDYIRFTFSGLKTMKRTMGMIYNDISIRVGRDSFRESIKNAIANLSTFEVDLIMDFQEKHSLTFVKHTVTELGVQLDDLHRSLGGSGFQVDKRSFVRDFEEVDELVRNA